MFTDTLCTVNGHMLILLIVVFVRRYKTWINVMIDSWALLVGTSVGGTCRQLGSDRCSLAGQFVFLLCFLALQEKTALLRHPSLLMGTD